MTKVKINKINIKVHYLNSQNLRSANPDQLP